ncbi:MAG TPA: hypothetical protein GXZ59_06210, partial [Clostridiaceae bacterium]|nr:hypothetical protein [Clostridiaceae bacterium]
EKNLALVQEIELAIAEKIHEITAKMSSGAVITPEEEQILSVTGTVSTEIMTTFISEQAASYLTGEISADSFIKQLNMLQSIERLQPIIKTYADSITELERARPAITAAEENLLEQEWVKAYQLWDDLLAEESAPATLVSFIERRKEETKPLFYEDYHSRIAAYIRYGKYYTAYDVLTDILPVFPDDPDLLNWLSLCSDILPKNHVNWTSAVEHISMRPVIVNPERAFDGDRFEAQADALMITAEEFKNILQQLLENNYILVSGDSFINREGKHVQFSVPEGKKPLILVIENYSYSPLRAESGTAECLEIIDEGVIAGQITDPESGDITLSASSSEIGILNEFCHENPEFSYDGAKATLALTGYRGLFGHVYSQAALNVCNEERQMLGLTPLTLSAEQIEENRVKIGEIADLLREQGYTLASFTWEGINIVNSGLNTIERDLRYWQEDVEPLVGEVRILHYPDGDHAQSDRAKLKLLTEAGFQILSGYGDRIYMLGGNGYVHTDKVYIGGDTLRKPERQNLDRFFDASRVISPSRP